MTGPLLAEATERLAAAGVASPRTDAELLLAALLGRPRAQLFLAAAPPPAAEAAYEGWVARRAAREPLQHITGRAPFRFVDLEVGPGVFVPRPETELLVDAVLPHLHEHPEPVVVDLGSGSGALAVAIADEVPPARVVAVERSATALRWLARNASGRAVRVVAGDVGDPELLRELHGRVDAVLANPPYVPNGTSVSPEVSADPAEAVFAGPDGLGAIPAFVARAAALLAPGGILAMEHDDSQGGSAPALLTADGRFAAVAAHRDLAGRPRYVTARREGVSGEARNRPA